jgi:hypothetical protein
MKKLIFILVFAIVAIAANAQRGRVQTLTPANLEGNNNTILAATNITGTYESLFISVKVERVSTAAGGTLYLKTGKDAASALVVNQTTNPSIEFAPNDTFATADVATQYWNITLTEPAAKYIEIYGDGDTGDTLTVTTSLMLK